MSQPHRAQHRQSEGDYYAETEHKLQQGTRNLGSEDRPDAQRGVEAQTQKAAAEYSVTQGQQLLEGQTARGDAPAPGQNYAANTHEELHGMATNNLDLEGINARSRVTNVYGNWLADASNQFRDAATAAGASWQGPAAQQANSFFQSTASHTEQTGNAMQLVSNHYSQQSAAAHYAKTNMPEPTGFNQQAELDKAAKQYVSGDLGGMATTMNGIQAKQQQADAAHAQAVQVMQNLDSTYHGTASTQPTYSPPPMPGSDNTSVSGFHGGGSYAGGPGGSYPGSPGAPGGSYLPPGGTPPPVTPGPQPPPSGYVPPGISSGSGNLVTNPGVRPPVMPPTTMPRADGLTLAGGPTGTGGTSGGDTVRGKSGAGRPGGGFAGSRVSGGGFTPKTPEGEKATGKPTGTGKPAGERLERGATAAANAKGKAGGAAGAAGAGKKKEEDKEHKNKVPIQEEVFEMRPERGPDGEKITPPVIGG